MLLKKKGVIEVQFNWIFILIVGGIILIFFFSIIMKQSQVSKDKIATTISLDMSSIFKGAQISIDTEHPVEIPPIDIEFECDADSLYSSYRIKNAEVSLGDSLVVFSPNLIIGDSRKMITWSKDWNVPYRIMNFLYLTSDTARYILIEDTLPVTYDMQKLYDDLPDLIQKDIFSKNEYDTGTIGEKNNYKTKFVRVGAISNFNVPTEFQGFKDEEVTMIVIRPGGGQTTFDGYGEIDFYMKDDAIFSLQGTTSYIGEASLFGGVFAESEGMYNCSMKKAMKRLGIVTDIYLNRTNQIINYYTANPIADTQNCKTYLGNALADLEAIYAVQDFNYAEVQNLFTTNLALEDKNRLILRYSCPVIY